MYIKNMNLGTDLQVWKHPQSHDWSTDCFRSQKLSLKTGQSGGNDSDIKPFEGRIILSSRDLRVSPFFCFQLLISALNNTSLVIIRCQSVSTGHLCDWQSWGTAITRERERTESGCAENENPAPHLWGVLMRRAGLENIISAHSSNCFIHSQVLWTLLPQRRSNRKVCRSLKLCLYKMHLKQSRSVTRLQTRHASSVPHPLRTPRL